MRPITVAWQMYLLSIFTFLLASIVAPISCHFTPDFGQWLSMYFGNDIRTHLERSDLGPAGSFGGKAYPGEMLKKQPVVFVHGVANRAGDLMKQAADFFSNNGYSFSELYGTTYANFDPSGSILQWSGYSMKCSYVKTVRALIVAVRLYTGRAVDVVSFSLGVPVSRKAILGGRCVDTGEDLGAPLTRFIDTFVGVAGPNHGISLQVGGVSLPGCVVSVIPVCNTVNGLYSGICPSESMFLQDINSQVGYEGMNRYSIYSRADQLVGYTVCGRITSQIPGQNGEKAFHELNHDDAFLRSFPYQMAMVLSHAIL